MPNDKQPSSHLQNQQGLSSTFEIAAAQQPKAMTNLVPMGQTNIMSQQIHPGSIAGGMAIPVSSSGVPAHFLQVEQQPRLQTNQVVSAMGLIPGIQPGQPNSSVAYQMPNMTKKANLIAGQQTTIAQAGKNKLYPISPKMATSTRTNHLIRPDTDAGALEQNQAKASKKLKGSSEETSAAAKAKQNRERNKEHARSTRLRKKAYVQQLKEMAEGLRAIQTEEIRQRRMAVQKMMGLQKARRTMIQTVLTYHSCYESDPIKWAAIIEETFWLKQPVTPFRSFRRSEVDKDCRMVCGIEAMICDAASLSVMIERIGCRNTRWKQLKRKKFIDRLESSRQLHPTQRAESSLSSESSTDSSFGSSGRRPHKRQLPSTGSTHTQKEQNKVNSSSESSNREKEAENRKADKSEESNEPQSKRMKESHTNMPRVAPHVVPSGGVIHEVRSNAGILKSETNSALRQVPNHAPVMFGSFNMFPDTSNELGAYYAVNEDDMIMIDDVLMCPFIFRSKNAVLCGALADCVMPGMLRANFSKGNRLQSLEMIFDAMGFMQQLDGANGREVNAQVIPGSLEMALMSSPNEARIITEARPPFNVVHINEAWTRLTKYSQVEVEGKEFLGLIRGDDTDPDAGMRPGKPIHRLEEVAKGRPACSTNIHYDKFGHSFVDFMSSYPLTK